jgi:hypothetical protein
MDRRCRLTCGFANPYTLTAKAETLLGGGQLPDDPLAKSACLWCENLPSASPIWSLRPARYPYHQDPKIPRSQDLCATV